MILKTVLAGNTYQFKDVKEVLAKANEPKSGDRLIGIAAESESERIAAKLVLANLTIEDLVENPTIPYEEDEVTRVNIDGLNKRTYESMKNMKIGELREWILSYKTTSEDLARASKAFTGEVVAGVAKIMSATDLVVGARKMNKVTRCRTAIGQPGTLSYRCQANSTTDDPETILLGVMEGVSFGCGDACLGINPVEDTVESTRRIADALYEFVIKNEVPTQISVLSHVTTQMEAVRQGAPLSMFFQSIAGTQKTNDSFVVNRDMLLEAYQLAKEKAFSVGPNLLYFETGQGSEVSTGTECGVDEMTLEGRTYGFARYFDPFMVNNVTGFIGPETIYDGKEMIRGNLEDHFMGKLIGLPMGMAPCYTNHTPINMDDQQEARLLCALAGANYFMGVPFGDDVMLAYADVSYHDDISLRELTGRKPAPEFFRWLVKKGIMTEDGHMTELAGDGSIFLK